MPTIETGRWLLVALAIVGLALAATAVSAHGTAVTTDHPYNGTEAPPYNGTAAEWDVWMETHMTEHMGPGSVAWMEAHTGVTIEEMAQHMAEAHSIGHGVGYLNHDHADGYGIQDADDYGVQDDTHREDSHRDDTRRGGYGMAGHGC